MSRVSEIRFVGYGVNDLEGERAFYRDKWGLKEVGEREGMFHYAAEGHDEPYVVRLRHASEPRIDVIGLAAETRADVDALFGKVKASGAQVIFEPSALKDLAGGYGFRFFSPDGLPFQISSDVERGQARQLTKLEGIPRSLSHVVLHSPDHKAAAGFFTDVLGFRISDWLGDFMVFLRCNDWHHRIAILPGPACLNHVAFDMLTVDDMMRGIGRLRSVGVEIGWGPGRHTAGDNTFSYFTTPNGFVAEYTAELERIDEATWTPHVYPPRADVMDQWGMGMGSPQSLPQPAPDKGLFDPVTL